MALHRDEIDDALELFLGADRQLPPRPGSAEALLDLAQHAKEVRAGPIHLVHEHHARHAVLIGLPPHGLGLRLHAADRAEDCYGAVENAQAALHLDREIDVARRVDNVDAVLGQALIHALPEAGRGGRRDRDAALLLLLHPVHDGRAIVNLTQPLGDPRVEQDALGGRRFAGIDVGHDADVPIPREGGLPCHC